MIQKPPESRVNLPGAGNPHFKNGFAVDDLLQRWVGCRTRLPRIRGNRRSCRGDGRWHSGQLSIRGYRHVVGTLPRRVGYSLAAVAVLFLMNGGAYEGSMVRLGKMLSATVIMSMVGSMAHAKMTMQTFRFWRASGHTMSFPRRTVQSGLPRNPRANSAGSIPEQANQICLRSGRVRCPTV